MGMYTVPKIKVKKATLNQVVIDSLGLYLYKR